MEMIFFSVQYSLISHMLWRLGYQLKELGDGTHSLSLFLLKKTLILFQVKMYPTKSLCFPFLVAKEGQCNGSENFGVGFPGTCLKKGTGNGRNLNFAIPPSLYFWTKVSIASWNRS